ncbi:MAG: hypothetical protein ABIX28_18215 [Vicinamibacterales bacterium]
MIIEMELGFDHRLDEHRLAQALDLLLDEEPVLGCRMVIDTSPARWEPVPRLHRRSLILTDLGEEYAVVRRCGLDAVASVQVLLCLWRADGGDRLLVKMTHEAGDGASLQWLVGRLAAIYSALGSDPAYQVPAHPEARRDLGLIAGAVPKRTYPAILWDFTSFMAPRWFPRATQQLPFPQESVGPWVPVITEIPAAHFGTLAAYAKARGASLNDLFLAAAYRALAWCGHWDGTSGLRIPMTVDLRRWCLSGPRPRGVSNLSSVEFPLLIRNLGRTFEDTLANVAVLTRQRKRHWPGLAVALMSHAASRWSGEALRRRAIEASRPTVTPPASLWTAVSLILSNEGALDGPSLRFDRADPVTARILPPFLALPGVHLCVSSYRGTITFAAVTPESGAAVLDTFLNALVDQLPIDAWRPSRPGPGPARADTDAEPGYQCH